MSFSFTHSIIPMSELRADPDKIKRKLKESPIIITNKGRPDFGVCDLETLELASQMMDVKRLVLERAKQSDQSQPLESVLKDLDKKYSV